ncbi:hypothetical protein [Flavobacterium hydrophilum]|uniref:Uncharacterized protein n=1 Tax=Flavobacterium hydrophilum TaxID=2211445 RepID=A0A2V4C197_9FLAO|nr:hypothetical protein [Flavobacterium hydrophilum]PXY45078.1 hypothetical protein DMB68_10245 [Flavobacterium hydrophilum]
MKESDKNIENLIEKMMSEETLQSPSIDFTSKIMAQVSIIEEKKLKVYKPLISKQTWFIIIAVLIAFSIYVIATGNDYDLKINDLYIKEYSNIFSGLHVSEYTLYAILIVPVMMLIQIPLLKNYYAKKYQL